MSWADEPDCGDPCDDAVESALQKFCKIPPTNYIQWDWHHVMDLATATDMYTQLAVRRDGLISSINIQEMINLSVKMARLAHMFNAVPAMKPPAPADMGLMLVQTGEAANGKPTYGLSMSYCGSPVGTPIMLETQWDATGKPVSIHIPTSMLGIG